MKKNVVILGSTGSIGRATLDIIRNQKDRFSVVGLACRENINLLKEQIEIFDPRYVCVYDPSNGKDLLIPKERILHGVQGMKELIAMDVHIVVNALPGSIGLVPTIETFRHQRILALANKESLVMAGRLIAKLRKKSTTRLIPVDSEHSALFQLLKMHRKRELQHLIITASGGPFREYSQDALDRVRPKEALNHPTWKMGKKVTLDSATLMNKGLEVIEARWLFDIEPSRIRVLIHPESIIHGIVELNDGSFIAHMAHPDMRIPIAYALNEERRVSLPVPTMDLKTLQKLTFFEPDMKRFPLLKVAYEALDAGDGAMVTMNAANEVAAASFIEGRIRFTQIAGLIEKTLHHDSGPAVIESLETILDVHERATRYTEELLRKKYA